jgi:hypothetical protein
MRIDEHARAVSYMHRQAKPLFLHHGLRQIGKSCRRHGVGCRRLGQLYRYRSKYCSPSSRVRIDFQYRSMLTTIGILLHFASSDVMQLNFTGLVGHNASQGMIWPLAGASTVQAVDVQIWSIRKGRCQSHDEQTRRRISVQAMDSRLMAVLVDSFRKQAPRR